jgi:hypothetical protein
LIANKTAFRELFSLATQIIRSANGKLVILMIPLPRYLIEKCCSDPSHITNKDSSDYEQIMREALTAIGTWMKAMAEMKRLKNVVLFNPMEPLGLIDDDFDKDRILQLWGADPVHPTEDAYSLIAEHLLAFAYQQIAEKRTAEAAAEAATAAGPSTAHAAPPKATKARILDLRNRTGSQAPGAGSPKSEPLPAVPAEGRQQRKRLQQGRLHKRPRALEKGV